MASGRIRRRRLPVRLHLTIPGWLFLGVTVLVGLAASRSEAPLTFVLFGAMLGSVALSAILAWRMVSGVSLEREAPDRVWQDQTAYFSYSLRNRRRWGSAMGLRVADEGLKGIDVAVGYCVHLEPGTVFRAGARFAPRRRGRTLLKRIRLTTSFPFGLVRAGRFFHRPMPIVVWPRRGALKRQMLHRGAVEASMASPAPVQGGQDEFFGLREYRAGDSLRWIHWRRSAARNTPVVREMSRPRPDILWLVVDTFLPDASSGEKLEKMLRLAATLIDHAFARGYKVGLAAACSARTMALAPAPGVGQRCRLLDALADVDENRTRRLDETVGRLERGSLRDAQVVILAREMDDVSGPGLLQLRSAARSVAVVPADDLDSFFADDALAAEEGA